MTAVWSVKYLNQAMMCFGNNVVVPVYYCTFTFFSVVGASVVYDEMDCVSLAGGLMFGGGSVCAFLGIILLNTGERKKARSGGGGPAKEAEDSSPVSTFASLATGPSLDDEEVELWLVDSDERAVRAAFAAVRTALRRLEPSESLASGLLKGASRRARGRPPRRSPATPPAGVARRRRRRRRGRPRGHRRTSSGTYLDPAGLRDDAATAAARALAAAIETEEASRLRAQNVALAYDDTDEEEAARGSTPKQPTSRTRASRSRSTRPPPPPPMRTPRGRRRACMRRRRRTWRGWAGLSPR